MTKEERKEWNKQYYLLNKDKYKTGYNKHKNTNPEYKSTYYKNNKDKFQQYDKLGKRRRRSADPKYKLIDSLRARLHKVLGGGRSKHTLEILGCSLEEFKHHLERQFEPWMTWENMGGKHVPGLNITWDIDHIIPISSAQTEEDIYRLSHYTNLRPLCSYNNRWIKRATH